MAKAKPTDTVTEEGAHVVQYMQGDEMIRATFNHEHETRVLRDHLRRSNTPHKYDAPDETPAE